MSDENPTWDDDIEGFFTLLDVGCMRDAPVNPPLDLGDYESVKTNAERIKNAVKNGYMPRGDRPWSEEKKAVFQKWIDNKMPKST